MIGWGLFGFILLIFAYLLFEFFTPRFKVDEEIEKDNRSVGFISFTISVGFHLSSVQVLSRRDSNGKIIKNINCGGILFIISRSILFSNI